ncbi:hypothetical protein ACSV9I_21435 [Rhizobium sp. G187]|uniref:hypothetical protein n=1 Tax=Rhizobium sp. G187 TaxID=3451352 RepID=UPI003EE67F10
MRCSRQTRTTATTRRGRADGLVFDDHAVSGIDGQPATGLDLDITDRLFNAALIALAPPEQVFLALEVLEEALVGVGQKRDLAVFGNDLGCAAAFDATCLDRDTACLRADRNAGATGKAATSRPAIFELEAREGQRNAVSVCAFSVRPEMP